MEYIWTIKMTNGDKYDVKANIQTIDEIIEIIFREGARLMSLHLNCTRELMVALMWLLLVIKCHLLNGLAMISKGGIFYV